MVDCFVGASGNFRETIREGQFPDPFECNKGLLLGKPASIPDIGRSE